MSRPGTTHRHSVSSNIDLNDMDFQEDAEPQQGVRVETVATNKASTTTRTTSPTGNATGQRLASTHAFTARPQVSERKVAVEDTAVPRPAAPPRAASTPAGVRTARYSADPTHSGSSSSDEERATEGGRRDRDLEDRSPSPVEETEVPRTPLETHNYMIRRIRLSFYLMLVSNTTLFAILCGTISKLVEAKFVLGILVIHAIIITIQITWGWHHRTEFSSWTATELASVNQDRVKMVQKGVRELLKVPIMTFGVNLLTMCLMVFLVATSFRARIGPCPEIPSDSFEFLSMTGQALFILYILVFVWQTIAAMILVYMSHEFKQHVKVLAPRSLEEVNTPVVDLNNFRTTERPTTVAAVSSRRSGAARSGQRRRYAHPVAAAPVASTAAVTTAHYEPDDAEQQV